jgi:hypothetical protein
MVFATRSKYRKVCFKLVGFYSSRLGLNHIFLTSICPRSPLIETADLIIASGKAHWLILREDKIVAKGKGKSSCVYVLCRVVSQLIGSFSLLSTGRRNANIL